MQQGRTDGGALRLRRESRSDESGERICRLVDAGDDKTVRVAELQGAENKERSEFAQVATHPPHLSRARTLMLSLMTTSGAGKFCFFFLTSSPR